MEPELVTINYFTLKCGSCGIRSDVFLPKVVFLSITQSSAVLIAADSCPYQSLPPNKNFSQIFYMIKTKNHDSKRYINV